MLNSAFPFIVSVILYLGIRIQNPDPDLRTQMNLDPTGSGSTSLLKPMNVQPFFKLETKKAKKTKKMFHNGSMIFNVLLVSYSEHFLRGSLLTTELIPCPSAFPNSVKLVILVRNLSTPSSCSFLSSIRNLDR